MAVSVNVIRGIIEESITILQKQDIETELNESVSRLESVRSVLIRNEKKIWLRTKKGREMLADVNEAAERLRESLASSAMLDLVNAALGDIEALARAIEDESRKRSMVVT